MATVLLSRSPNTFFSQKLELRHLSPLFGSSRIAGSAYQKRPTFLFFYPNNTPLEFDTFSQENDSFLYEMGLCVFSHTRKRVDLKKKAFLRETSEGTSYQMVRLVFRPYTQLPRSICASEPLRASTRVYPGLTLSRHSSPSFGSSLTPHRGE